MGTPIASLLGRPEVCRAAVVSVDIFGTSLVRQGIHDPLDVFAMMGGQEFVEARTLAEAKAHRKCWARGWDSADIQSIYQELPVSDREREGLMLKEMELERQLCRADPEVLEVVRVLDRKGKPIIYTSDMYLPSSFLGQVLAGVGFPVRHGSVYVSCETGKCKSTGRMFGYILGKLHLEPAQVLHIGDYWLADYCIPRALGMQVFHYQSKDYPTRQRVADLVRKARFWLRRQHYEQIYRAVLSASNGG